MPRRRHARPLIAAAAVIAAALAFAASAGATYDPGAPGPFDTALERVHAGNRAVDVGYPVRAELTSEVVYPVTNTGRPAGGRRPLVVFLHGQHATCYRGEDSVSDEWPCRRGRRPFPSYQGYRYATELLASQGYVTVSISANGVDGQDNTAAADNGNAAFARLVDAHLRLLAGKSPRSVRRPGSPYPRWIRRIVNPRRTLLVGHSRGGEGVASTALRALTAHRPYRIRGLVGAATTNGGWLLVPKTPQMVVLPQCDGDVFDLEGQLYAEAPRLMPRDRSLRSAVWLPHGNHNFLNTMWTPGLSVAPQSDDGAIYNVTDGDCREGARLSSEAERGAAAPYFAAAAALWLRGDRRALKFLDGRPARPPSVGGVETRVAATGGGGRVLEHRWRRPTRATGAMRERTCVVPRCAERVGWTSPELPHWLQASEQPPLPAYRTWRLGWSGPGTAWTRLVRPADLTSGGRLAARVAVDPAVGNGPRVALAVRDRRGRSAAVPVPAEELVPLSTTDLERKLWGQQVEVPVADLGAANPRLDLSRITHVGLAGESPTGRVFVVDFWHRRANRISWSGPGFPQVTPKLRFRRIPGGYRVATGMRVLGPAPKRPIRAHLEVFGFCGEQDTPVVRRRIRIPAGERSVTLKRAGASGKLTNMVATVVPVRGAVTRTLRVRVPGAIPRNPRGCD